VQLTWDPGTAPSEVGELNVQLTVKTTVPGGCSTVMMALVKAMSVMSSIQFVFGHSGERGTGVTGDCVTTPNGVLPFLISDAGIGSLPVTVIGAGLCPAG